MGRPQKPLERDGSPVREFAFWLRDLRRRSGLTYDQLGKNAHYATSTVQEATSGRRFPTLRLTTAFVKACGGDVVEWRAYWAQIQRALDQDMPDRYAASITPPWADTLGPSAAGSAPAGSASPVVAPAAPAPPAADGAEGWYVHSFTALLRLDTTPVEALEQRVIVATADGLSELVTSVSVPRHPADADEPHGLESELMHGGSLELREQPYESYFRNVIVLPRPLRKGERHQYALRLRIPPGQPMAPHYVHVPFRRSDHFELRVRFNPRRMPQAIWMLCGAPTAVIYEQRPSHETLVPDRFGEVHVSFRDLRLGLGYGICWKELPAAHPADWRALNSTRYRPDRGQPSGRISSFTGCARPKSARPDSERSSSHAASCGSTHSSADRLAGLNGTARNSGMVPPGGWDHACVNCYIGEALRLRRVLGHALSMEVTSDVPALDEIVAELRLLRERGLVRLRHTDLDGLTRAASRTGVPAAVGGGAGAVEALVRAAVDNLGGGSLGAAAAATFGLGRGERDMAAQDRRRRAALNYGVSVERFRKHHERIILEQVAEEILKLCMTSEIPGRPQAVRAELDQQINLTCQVGGHRVPVAVHIEPVELLSDVDIIVVPDNIYFELPQHFKSSVSAAIRRAAAIKSDDGEIITDVIGDELTSWLRRHGRVGLPVAPGTVVVAGPGQLAVQRVRRIYHAAIAVPVPGTNYYSVEPAAFAGSVRNVLAMARAERGLFEPELSSIAFPLLGAGRGGLTPATSISWLWTALDRDMRKNGPWSIHFVTITRSAAELIVAKLTEAGALAEP